MSKLVISCQVVSKAHYLPEKPDTLLFIQSLRNFQDREGLSGIVAPSRELWLSDVNWVCFCCYCCENSLMLLYLRNVSKTLHFPIDKKKSLRKFEILVCCHFIALCWCQVKASNAAMHSSVVVFEVAAPPRAVLLCAFLNLTGVFLPSRMGLGML